MPRKKPEIAVEEPEGAPVIENPEPLNATVSWENPNVITNNVPGFTLHLGDGRKLKFGESAVIE